MTTCLPRPGLNYRNHFSSKCAAVRRDDSPELCCARTFEIRQVVTIDGGLRAQVPHERQDLVRGRPGLPEAAFDLAEDAVALVHAAHIVMLGRDAQLIRRGYSRG